jgi:uncharacterized membrane protein YoaK (UPF0700 family)
MNEDYPTNRKLVFPFWLFPGRDGRLLLLGWVAGSVDAIGYLGLGRIFTANMTGNTVLLGVALGQGQTEELIRATIALAGFILGVAIGSVVVAHDSKDEKQENWSSEVTVALVLEGLILVVAGFSWYLAGPALNEFGRYALIILASIAMGIQSAAVQHLRVAGISTTYVTGTLTSLVSELVERLRLIKRRTSQPGRPVAAKNQVQVKSSKRELGLKAALWFTYLLAATVSSLLLLQWQVLTLLLPLLGLAFVILSAFWKRLE